MTSTTMPTNIAKGDTTLSSPSSFSTTATTATTTTTATTSNTTPTLRFISPTHLQEMIDRNPSAVQVVDCRSFLNYNTERIIGSVNVYCPPLVKRRFQSCLPLATMLSAETKVTLCRSSVEAVVLHDQSTDEALYHLGQSDLPLVLNSLWQLLGQKDYMVLSGGYCRFRQEYPNLCSSHTSFSGQLRHVKRSGSPKLSGGLSAGSPSALSSMHISTSSTHMLISMTPVELLPYLYIGDAGHSSRKELLQDFKISAILNVSTSCENHFPSDFRYKVIPVEDSNNANLLEWFQDAILFIEEEHHAGGKVLVHCHGGISRSATVCLAYLMYSRHLRLDDAFEYVKSRRNVISPNANFMMQLTQFESELKKLGFCGPAASLHQPLSPCRFFSFGSCPHIAKFCVEEEEFEDDGEDEEGGQRNQEKEEEDGEDDDEDDEEESSSGSDLTPLSIDKVSQNMNCFIKPLASPS